MHLPHLLPLFLSLPFTLAAESSPQYKEPDLFQTTLLDTTNLYRRQHSAPALAWNTSLATSAQAWSDGCKFTHSGTAGNGENLASGYPNVTVAVEVWGEERGKYNFARGGFSSETGHFTQLVWLGTTTVGCARTECNGGQEGGKGDAPGWYVVCEYFPAGNVLDHFQENVLPQLPDGEVPTTSVGPSTTGQVGTTATATASATASATTTAEGAAGRFQGGVGLLWAAPGLAVVAGV